MITLIVAHDKNLVIGKDNRMPWHYPEDLAYFKRMTLNKNVLMGFNTFKSIVSYLGKPLPDRKTIVLTTKEKIDYDVEIVNSIEEALTKYREEELIVAGGSSIYEQFIKYADKLLITLVDGEYPGDSYFPKYSDEFEMIDEKVKDKLKFRTYGRRK